MKQIFIKQNSVRTSERGATLLLIIIAMIVLAVIGAAMYSMTSTSALNQATAQKSARAYYLSESCVRVAASEYKASSSKDATLVNLHGITFTLPDNQGSCTVYIYPYWFYATTAYAANAASITLYLPGAVPLVDADGTTSITLPANANLKKKNSTDSCAVFSSASVASSYTANVGTAVTFTLSTPFTNAIASGDEFYLGYNYIAPSIATPLNPPNVGGNLILNIATTDTNDLSAKIFPPEKGSIFVESSTISQYSYDKRVINTTSTPHTVTLTNIQAISGTSTPTWPVQVSSIAPGTPIYMGKSLGLRSTSTYGN